MLWLYSKCPCQIRIYQNKTVGCAIPPFLSQNDSESILSGNACPQDKTTIKIIYVASLIGVSQDTTFFIKGFGKIYKLKFHRILFLLSINLIPSPDWYICIGLLVDTHIGPILSHNGISGVLGDPKHWGYKNNFWCSVIRKATEGTENLPI